MILPSHFLHAYSTSQTLSEEDVEEILSDLLRVSFQLDAKAKNTFHNQKDVACNSSFLISRIANYFHEGTNATFKVDHEENPSEYFVEWKCTLDLLRMILKPIDSDPHQNIMIPGHVLFRIVLMELSSSFENHEILSPSAFLCMILLCEGLKASLSCQIRRWKRLQSMCCEMIAISQRLSSRYFYNEGNIVASDIILQSLVNYTSIVFLENLVPTITIILTDMPKGEEQNLPMELGIASGLVDVALTLARVILEQSILAAVDHETNTTSTTLLIMKLFGCIKDTSETLFNFLIVFPFLVHSNPYLDECAPCVKRYLQQLKLKYGKDFWKDVIPLITICATRELDLDQPDKFWGMQTQWDSVSVASILYIIHKEGYLFPSLAQLENDNFCSNSNRDFEFLFPCVENLLGQQLRISDKEILQVHYYQSGLDLLSILLIEEPVIRLPLVPLGCILNPSKVVHMLFNHTVVNLVNQSEINYAAIDRDFTILQKLLVVYDTKDVISMLKDLIRCCPFPFLLPKLIDMLRPSVVKIGSNDQDLLSDLVSAVGEFLEEMTEDTSTNSFERLLEKVEIYCCTISLIALGFTFHHKMLAVLGDAYPNLATLSEELTLQLDNWIEEDRTDNERFRLYLLENSLRRLIKFKPGASISMK